MFLDDIKQNINKIDFDLKNLFENVYITEKADKQGYFVEISCNKMFLFEGCKKRVEVKTYISKDNLKFDNIKWSYSLNPLRETAQRIDRVSLIKNLAKDIYDIAENKRMVKEYFNSLESHVDLILECGDAYGESIIRSLSQSRLEKINKIVEKYTPISNVISNLDTNMYFNTRGTIEYTSEISMANKFRLEKELMESGLVDFVSFNEGIVKVTVCVITNKE